MLRNCAGTEDLAMVFAKIGKDLTRENAAELCAMAIAAPELFYQPAFDIRQRWYHNGVILDIITAYCKTRSVSKFGFYHMLIANTIRSYPYETYKDAATTEAVFTAIDDMIAKLEKLFTDEGFPSMINAHH